MHRMSLEERFWSRVQRAGPDECWNWTGTFGSHPRGLRYGTIGAGGRTIRAHRLAWEIANGALIPGGLLVRHTCDNPSCCNPKHLVLGTHRDNSRDCEERGRGANSRKTQCAKGHPLSGENLRIGADGRRHCRTCNRFYNELKRQSDPDYFRQAQRKWKAKQCA